MEKSSDRRVMPHTTRPSGVFSLRRLGFPQWSACQWLSRK